MAKSIIPKRIKATIKNIGYSKYKALNKGFKCNQNTVVFDMRDLIPDRRLAQLALQFQALSYEVCVYMPNYRSYVKCAFLHKWDYSESLFSNGIINEIPDECKLIICGKEQKTAKHKTIVYDDGIMDKIKDYTDKEFYFPILFHPSKLKEETEVLCLNQSCHKREIGILFIGNCSETYKKYEKSIHQKYSLFTRHEVISFLRQNCKDIFFEPNNIEELNERLANGSLSDKIVVIDKFRISDGYFEFIAKARFFLHTTGVVIPFCHNHIESAACGCIPISQFNDLYPGLNEINSMGYSSLEQLAQICKEICVYKKIDTIDYEKMSEAIQQWYREYCSFECFNSRLESFLKSKKQEEHYYMFKEQSPSIEKIEKITGFKL